MGTKLTDLLTQLESIEMQRADSPLVIYEPGEDHKAFYHALCAAYLKSSDADRRLIRVAV